MNEFIEESLNKMMYHALIYLYAEGGEVKGADMKADLGFDQECYPSTSKTQGKSGWLQSIIIARLESNELITYSIIGNAGYLFITDRGTHVAQYILNN